MGGCRCSYKNCSNTTKSAENLHFFHFPVKQKDICVHWIENSKKQQYYELDVDQLKNKAICEIHFEKKWFYNNSRKRIITGAIPTLDGKSSDKADGDFRSNQYTNVKLIPNSEDGSAFVLEAENMYTRSAKIESYIIKNGILVPVSKSNSQTRTRGRVVKQPYANSFINPSSSASASFVEGADIEIANINTSPGISPAMFVKTDSTSSISQKSKSDAVEEIVFEDQSTGSGSDEKKPVLTRIANGHNVAKGAVSKVYLRQIKKHSREIANMKRLFSQKISHISKMIKQSNPVPGSSAVNTNESTTNADIYSNNSSNSHSNIDTITAALEVLRPHLPPTLFAVVSLHLGERAQLTDEDISFFTELHTEASTMYRSLCSKYKWTLPVVSLVTPTTMK